MSRVLVGTASWTDPTLLKSGWYPPSAKTAEARLAYYAERFDVVEVDSTFYAIPAERNAGLWVDRTPKSFRFDIKAFALFTKHAAATRGIPKAVREKLPAKARVYPKDVPPGCMDELWSMFSSALLPLESAGKLGAVFFQFPEWFVPSNENLGYLDEIGERLPGYRIAVEFRRRSWMDPPERAHRTLERLRALGYAYVCVDMPQGFDSSMPDTTAVTSKSLAVVRFHGHNKKSWKAKGLSAAERFDYLYSKKQLAEWAPRIGALAGEAREVHAVFNNCYGDKAVRNASQMAALLDE
jgi:uncharacterized protein YecE (DUF72 family)